MNAVWQLPWDTWPHWDDLRACSVNRIYFQTHREKYEGTQVVGYEHNDRQVSFDYFQAVGTQKFQYAVVYQPYWDGSPSDYRVVGKALHDALNRATNGDKLLWCPALFNIENPYRDPAWLVNLFKYWRTLRPTRRTCWVLEGMQGGWIAKSEELVSLLNADKYLYIMGECFYGNMDPIDPLRVRADLISAGIVPEKVLLCYDAAHPRPANWNGQLFHSGRLTVA